MTRPGRSQVEINYISYQASTAPCGDWSEDLAYTIDNKTAAEFRLRQSSTISPPWSPIRAICWVRAPMDGADAAAPPDRHRQLRNRARSRGADKSADQTIDRSSGIGSH